MTRHGGTHIYGPVPSKRLGRSLGVDLVPFKTCTYDCVYCQLGRTTDKTVQRRPYVPIDEVMRELEQKLAGTCSPDFIGLAGSGEPTLHSGIGDLIARIKETTDVPVAVLTNGSLLWMPEVREELMLADVVLPSLDAGDETLFRRVNRPHPDISFDRLVGGLEVFIREFSGDVWLEVLMLDGVTGTPEEARKIAELVERLHPARVQLNTAWRPPAESGVRPVSADQLADLSALFTGAVDIVGEESGHVPEAGALSNVRDGDILQLLRRRPCTAADAATGLNMHVAEVLKSLDALMRRGEIETFVVEERTFYVPAREDAKRLD